MLGRQGRTLPGERCCPTRLRQLQARCPTLRLGSGQPQLQGPASLAQSLPGPGTPRQWALCRAAAAQVPVKECSLHVAGQCRTQSSGKPHYIKRLAVAAMAVRMPSAHGLPARRERPSLLRRCWELASELVLLLWPQVVEPTSWAGQQALPLLAHHPSHLRPAVQL